MVARMPPLASPRIYQKEVLDDTARFILWVKSRQIGGSWTAGARAAERAALRAAERGIDQVLMSRGLRQAKRLLKKVNMHLRAIDAVRQHEFGLPTIIGNAGTEQIELTNGAAIMAVPCDDETTVGDAADVTIDEYGLFPNSEAIFEALAPIIMNGYSIFILSTPRGRKNMFAKLALDPRNNWSKHKTTIFDAERQGLVLRDDKDHVITAQEFIDEVRKNGMSETAIRQEFLCEFIDASTAFFTLSLICRIQDTALSTEIDWHRLAKESKENHKAEFYVGIDVGRYHDLTVVWLWERITDRLVCRGVLTMQDTPFDVQEEQIARILDHRCVRRTCIDATGLGIAMGERLVQRYGEYRVEPVTFTAANKAHMASNLKLRAEREELAIPADEAIQNDFHAISQIATPAGNVRYDADRSVYGHADRFWAAALGVEAVEAVSPGLVMAFAGQGAA